MNSVQAKVSTLLTVILIAAAGGGTFPVAVLAANLPNGDAASIPANHALLSRVCGEVVRADMVDESREVLGDPKPAAVNDLLSEGSVLGTRNHSWAEVKWTSVTTRIWQNTVIQIRPSKRFVFLQEGSLRFQLNKNRPDKAAYDIRTRVLQARVHGTTVHVDVIKSTCSGAPDVERITVLEGNIDVRNLQNNSVVHLTPGVVYEVRVQGALKSSAPAFNLLPQSLEKSQNLRRAEPIAEVNDIRLNPAAGEVIFQDKLTRALAYTANSKAILNDPLIGGANPIPSYALIQHSLAKTPGFAMPGSVSASSSRVDKLIARNLKIVAVPSKTSYAIGPNVGGSALPLPAVAYTDLPPSGTVPNDSPLATAQAPVVKHVQTFMPLPVLPAPAEHQDGASFSAARASFNTPVLPGNATSTLAPVLSSPVAVNSALRGYTLPTAPSMTSSFPTAPAMNSVLSDRRSGAELVNINVLGGRTN